MLPLLLQDFHRSLGAAFGETGGRQCVLSYSSVEKEYLALTTSYALLDFSSRSRICLLGRDRGKFLQGQITNDVLRLVVGAGCYAALVSAKGKIQSDLFVYKLPEELLLDFEPGLASTVIQRLERFIIADDVQVIDVAPHYGLLSLQGPKSDQALEQEGFPVPESLLQWKSIHTDHGETYVVNNPRLNSSGFDLFVPVAGLENTARSLNFPWAGVDAFEIARIEEGIPRFGLDITDTNLPQEAEIQDRAVSFDKGCYIGQEVIARIRTYGQVAKALRLIRLPSALPSLPRPGEKLFHEKKEVGYLASTAFSPKHRCPVAFAYIRKEHNTPGSMLDVGSPGGPQAQVLSLPYKSST